MLAQPQIVKLSLRRRRPAFALCLSTLLASVATGAGDAGAAPSSRAADAPPAAGSPKVQPDARILLGWHARTGKTFPSYRPSRAFETSGRLPIVVRFRTALETKHIEALSHAGVTFERTEPIASGAYLASADASGIDALDRDADVSRVSVDLYHAGPRPDARSLDETRASVAKRAAMAKDGKALDGKGVTIADLDTPVFAWHPALYRADGGTFAWVDVNGDGKLTPDKDGIDIDGDGKISKKEILHERRSQVGTLYGNHSIDSHDDFQVDVDYLYLDTNGNGRRDFHDGFEESTPAYGEPMYIVDDANHDGVTQPSERLLALKTSKIRAVNTDTTTFERGKTGATGLVKYDPTASPQAEGMAHATNVAGILVGGVPGLSRWPGFAPEADLIVSELTNRGAATNVQWAIDRGANIIITEFAPYTDVSLDGSSEDELILDAANDKGVFTVSPAGNLAGGFKHRTVTLQPGEQTIPLATSTPGRYATVAFHYKGPERAIVVKMNRPEADPVTFVDNDDAGKQLPDGTWTFSSYQTTTRGTRERFVHLARQSDALAKGSYDLTVTLDGTTPLEAELFSGDDVSDWVGGLSFDKDTPNHTVCNPATSDKTISVAAYVLYDSPDYGSTGERGALESYSSRGPLLSGAPGISIAAPDNPVSTNVVDAKSDDVMWSPFGGTSGAGPHVAGAIALMRQALPKESVADIKKRIFDHAAVFGNDEDATGIGKGRLDVASALGVTAEEGALPKVAIALAGGAPPGGEATVHVTASGDGKPDALMVRWDIGYDGKFDTDWGPIADATVPLAGLDVGATVAIKAEVRDGLGNTNGATLLVQVATPEAAPAPATSTESSGGCGCTAAGARVSGPALGILGIALALGTLRRRRRELQR